MKYTRIPVVAALLAGGLLSAVNVSNASDDDGIDKQAISNATVTFNGAVDIALAKVPGIVLEAEFESEDGKSIWEVEILGEDEKLYEITVDANTGEAMIEQDDD